MRRGGRHLVFILFMALLMGFHNAQAHVILDKVLKLQVLLMGFLIAHTHEILDKVLKLRALLMGFLIAHTHEINPLLQGNTMLFNADNHNIYL
ncbi:MAG: hypothetical protein HXN40_05165 [Prevotella histicola]|uniref:hypothetical protein n=1 Tax=Prevotella histicola TaxID=470565 RepID=UPI001CB4E9C9|nr:hypothetical protein [Prevotella histicola]MBF1422961.1 hypothetical protein [Prevotella histicola]